MGGNVLDPGDKGVRERGKNVEGRSEGELRGWKRREERSTRYWRSGKDADEGGRGEERMIGSILQFKHAVAFRPSLVR